MHQRNLFMDKAFSWPLPCRGVLQQLSPISMCSQQQGAKGDCLTKRFACSYLVRRSSYLRPCPSHLAGEAFLADRLLLAGLMVTVMRHAYAPLTQHQQQPLALSLCLLTLEQFFFQLKNFKRSLGYKVHPQQMEQHLKGPDLQHLLKADPCNISHAIHSHRQFLPTHCRGVPVIGMTKRP